MSTKYSNNKRDSLKIDFQPVLAEKLDDQKEEKEDNDTSCGIGSFRPNFLQKLNNPKIFLFNYSVLSVIQGAFFTYLIGCMSTLEKRYAYESKVTGIIMIADEISPILFGMLLGYFGGKSHRPRIVAAGMLITVLSCFVMSMPYFIFGPIRLQTSQYVEISANRTNEEFCDKEEKSYFCDKKPTMTAVSFLFLGEFLKGLGSLAFNTIGTSYMDDSVKKKDSPLYFGTLFSLRFLGPTTGFLLSSLCLSFYEDPFYDPGFGTRDPRWVGAWWIGFIILGVLIFIFSVPMILFPKRFPQKKIATSLQKKKPEGAPKSPIQQLKDMGRAIKRLAKNPILMCHYLGGVLRLNGIIGYYMLLPKYMEMQFRQSASKASLYSGPASIIGVQIGIFLGGISIRKFRPRPRVLTGAILIAETFTVISLISCMFITCPVDQMSGTSTEANPLFNLENKCNIDCKCTTKVYTPVCGPDGKSTYFSPCFAGCTGYNKTDNKEVFTNCQCVHDVSGEFTVGDANKSYCGFECHWLITFIVILSVGKLLASTARVGNTLVVLRCIDPEDKSIALGASSGIFSLLAFIPYPLIYGALTDASCLVWEKSCGKTGNCWVYDTDKFRYLLHGVSAVFVFVGCLTDVLVWILSPRIKNLYDDDNDDNEKSAEDIEEAELINNGAILGFFKTANVNGSIHSLNEKISSQDSVEEHR